MKKKFFLVIILTLIPIIVTAMGAGEDFDSMLSWLLRESVEFIQTDNLHTLILEKEDIIILDTRDIKEYEVSHIQNARFVGYKSFSIEIFKNVDKQTPVVVYCSVGYRSEKIGEKLLKAGFKNVYNLYGGIFQWHNDGYPIYNSGSETIDIHGYSKSWGKWIEKGNVIY